MPGEFEFIDWVRAQAPSRPDLPIPPGDDLAALRWPASDLLLVGADQVLDGVHFDSTVHCPRDIGRKAMNRNLSDCAAMACLPAAAVVTAALPRGTSIECAKELYRGMKSAADAFDCPIVGGDTATWGGRLAISVAILGRSAGVDPVRRSGAKPGDGIFVTGPLGGSILGRHLTFEPRVAWGRRLGETRLVTAMIDLSDGLSRDLAHICRESRAGAVVYADAVPVHPDVTRLPHDGRSPLHHALHDGEDYELLFTAPMDFAGPSQTLIGRMTAEPGIVLQHADGRREPLEPKAWEHRL